MQVVKYPVIGLNHDDDDVNLKPGWCREIWNAVPKNGFSKTGIRNLQGTLVRTNAGLAAGTNTCIGAFSNKANNRILYFIHNSNNDHSIWYFSPLDNTHTLVFQTPFLLFSLAFPILSCDFIEDICNFVDNNNEDRSIIISRAVAGLYTFNDQVSFEKQLSLYKLGPQFPPTTTATRAIGTAGFNNITSDSYQFCVQYVFYDNTVSLVSPLSKINVGDVFPVTTNTRNRIDVQHSVDTDIYSVIKKIYWIYVKNDDGNFQLFRETDLDVTDPSRVTPNQSIHFYDTETVTTIFPQQVNFIPNKSKNVLIHDQRSIVTLNQFDYEGSVVKLNLTTSAIGSISSTVSKRVCLPNSSYTVGFLYFDVFGRTPGITAKNTIVMPEVTGSLKIGSPIVPQDFFNSSDKLRITWSVTGTPPSWAKSCAVALKPNNTIESSYACLAFPMFYKRNGSRSSGETGAVEDNNKVFFEAPRNNWEHQIYWKVPANMPFQLDGSYKMRIMNNSVTSSRDVEDIIAVEGDKVITENFGITDWLTLLGTSKGFFNVMFEKYKEEPDEVFFEVGSHFDCSNGTLVGVGGIIEGDHYYMRSKLRFLNIDVGDLKYGGAFSQAMEHETAALITVPVISQSPVHSNVVIKDVSVSVESNKKKRFFKKALGVVSAIGGAAASIALGPAGGAVSGAVNAVSDVAIGNTDDKATYTDLVKRVYTPDYTKIASDSGRPWIEVANKKVSYEPNTISISDPYVVNSKVNGLSDYRNLFQLPINRTEIVKMISIGAQSIFLAIHKRTTTSLATYVGGKILNTTDGSQLVGDGNSIIGYHNELAGGYGTIYPDSVVTHNGRAWWFDPYSGEVVRYANNGLTPIGSIYKMHNFFRQKGDQFIDPTGRNVIAGYDANLDILYLTFRSTNPEEEITVAFIDRQGEERWISFEEFLPERYAFINERLFGFVNGEMWEFNQNSTYNLFFGQQYTTRVRHLFNTEFSKEKRLLNIGVESNKKWAFDPITVAKFGTDQETSLAKSNFTRRDDVFYADVKRDKNTATGLIPAGKSALVAGQPMIGKVYDVTLENDDTTLVELDFLNYGFIPSPGHNIV